MKDIGPCSNSCKRGEVAEITDLKAFLVFMLPTFVVVAVIGLRYRLKSDEFETHNSNS